MLYIKTKENIKSIKKNTYFVSLLILLSGLTLTSCFNNNTGNSDMSSSSTYLTTAPKVSSTPFVKTDTPTPEVLISPTTKIVISPTPKSSVSTKELEEQYNLAFTNHLQGKYKEAVSIADKIIAIEPSFYKAYNIKGIALCFDGNTTNGLDLINKSLTLKPDYGYGLFNKALAYKLKGDNNNAIIWFDKNLKVEDYSWSYYGKSTIYADRGDVENAVLNLKKAMAIDTEVKNSAKTDNHFNAIRNNTEFQKLFNDVTSLNPKEILPILCYHAVNHETYGIKNLFIKPSDFDKQMKYLKDNNYTVVTFDDIPNLKNINKPIIITFDDGYEDNYTEAYPILKKYNFKATVFMMTDAIDQNKYLKSKQILEMKDLINFQSHTATHNLLNEMSLEDVEHELSHSKKVLEDLTGQKINVLAYPVGEYNQNVLTVTKKYYTYGTILNDRLFKSSQNKLTIDRFYIPRNLSFSEFKKYVAF